jgi:hypothetical protein
MTRLEKLLEQMRSEPANVSFSELKNAKGKAKPYQVRQVLQAIDKLKAKS